jgi:hypothetical protein
MFPSQSAKPDSPRTSVMILRIVLGSLCFLLTLFHATVAIIIGMTVSGIQFTVATQRRLVSSSTGRVVDRISWFDFAEFLSTDVGDGRNVLVYNFLLLLCAIFSIWVLVDFLGVYAAVQYRLVKVLTIHATLSAVASVFLVLLTASEPDQSMHLSWLWALTMLTITMSIIDITVTGLIIYKSNHSASAVVDDIEHMRLLNNNNEERNVYQVPSSMSAPIVDDDDKESHRLASASITPDHKKNHLGVYGAVEKPRLHTPKSGAHNKPFR